MDKEKKLTAKSMMELYVPPTPEASTDILNNNTPKQRFRLFSLTSSISPKKSAKKLQQQSKGYGSYSDLFRAQSYDSLCTGAAEWKETGKSKK